MGYDLHITRKEHWADEADKGLISIAEWRTHKSAPPNVSVKTPW